MTEHLLFSQQYLPLRPLFFNGFPHSGQLAIFESPHQEEKRWRKTVVKLKY
jgi:hypothetical protein